MNNSNKYWISLMLWSLIPQIICHFLVAESIWPIAVGVDGEYAVWSAEILGALIIYPLYLTPIIIRLKKRYNVNCSTSSTILVITLIAIMIIYLFKYTTCFPYNYKEPF